MCGIAGIINWMESDADGQLSKLLAKMSAELEHRGPDDSGTWLELSTGTGFAHRRLSIIDLSPQGRQPFTDAENHHVLVFNGEIYNYLELKEALQTKGVVFRTHTDTEVLLEALKFWGHEAISRFDGMFAFAFHDIRSGRTLLARDPFGEKPLYWTSIGSAFAFASELTALLELPGFDDSVDSDSLAEYFYLQYIDSSLAFYRGARKLSPGSWMVVDQGSVHSSGRYFNFQPGEDKAAWNVDSLADELEDILVCSLRRRLISDVPLGAFLSGGVDSAIIAALIRKRLNRPLHTFSLGFTNTPFSEHEAARSTARHLGCTHHECLVPPEELGKYTVVANALDEPNADTSCLPLFLLSRFARTKIKVAVSGDGADEMFAGYSRYARMQALVGNGENSVAGEQYYTKYLRVWPETQFIPALYDSPDKFFVRRDKLFSDIDTSKMSLCDRLRVADVNHYLPGSVLAKVDRMSMRHGLEVRTPFLSFEVAKFAQRLPQKALVNNGTCKFLLRHLAKRYLPALWVDREKMGFSLPNDNHWAGILERDMLKGLRQKPHAVCGWLNEEKLIRNVSKSNLFQLWSLMILRNYSVNHPSSPFLNKDRLQDWLSQRKNSSGKRPVIGNCNKPNMVRTPVPDWCAINCSGQKEGSIKYKLSPAPLLYDRETGAMLPFTWRKAFDDFLKLALPYRPVSLTEILNDQGGSLIRRDTPKRAFQIAREFFAMFLSRCNAKTEAKALRQIISSDNNLPISTSKPNRIVFLIHDLAAAGAQRQLFLHAMAARDAGFEASVLVSSPLHGLNAHYLHLFQDAEIPVHSCAYRNPMANPSTMASVFNNDHGDFLEMLPHHRREMIWNLISHLCILRPDRLHCFVDLSCLIGGISTILTKIPYVLFSFRNKNPTHFSFGHPWFFPYYRQLIESKRVILTGNSSAGNSDYANWLEISQGSIAIVRNGINQKEWKKISPNERDAARRHFNIGKNHACIAGVFQLEHYKTPLSFLKVIDRLVNRIQQPLKVLVAGNGQLSTVFRNAIRDYKLEDVVQMLGHRKDVPRILAAADLLLLSSGYGEGTPNVLLEAQARGLPVVTSDAGGGASEALDDGKSGFKCQNGDLDGLADACVQILSDRSLAIRMGEAGVRFINNNFSMQLLRQRLAEIYCQSEVFTCQYFRK